MKKICKSLNKKCFLFFLFIVCSIQVMSQEESPKKLDVSGFMSWFYSLMTIDGKVVVLRGVGGALVFDHSFFVGGYALVVPDLLGFQNISISINNINYDVHFIHGGLLLGYILNPHEYIHYKVETLLGWGKIDFNDTKNFHHKKDRIYVFYPKVSIEKNGTPNSRVSLGIGYKKTIGVDTYYDATDFNGLIISLALILRG